LHDCDPDSLHLMVKCPCSTCHTKFSASKSKEWLFWRY